VSLKTCVKCGQEKPRTTFYARAANKDGLESECIPCRNERSREWAARNRERAREIDRRWKRSHTEQVAQTSRRVRIKREYGLTIEEYEAILARGCAICGIHDEAICLDHDHTTGAVRDALCAHCNRGIGLFRDDPGLLTAAANYLAAHRSASTAPIGGRA
jgi:hypothetical protein